MKRCPMTDRISLLKQYLHGNPSPSIKSKIEMHLKACGTCSEVLEGLKRGESYARMIPKLSPSPEVWKRIGKILDATHQSGIRTMLSSRWILGTAVLVTVAIAVAIWGTGFRNRASSFSQERTYREVALSSIAENMEPHIVTEGVVSEIAIDQKDGDYRIKLTENLRQAGPFIMCEVLGPSKIELPEVGKRIRVYGVSRFDAKPGHQWHEVHPVFGIEKLSQ